MSIYISLILHFRCHRICWSRNSFIKEANTGKGLKVQGWQKPLFKYAVPIIIAVIYIRHSDIQLELIGSVSTTKTPSGI